MNQKIVLGIIRKNSKFLIGKVRKDKLKDFGNIEYVFPGGKINESETPKKAVTREVKEETGFCVKIIKLIDKKIHPINKKCLYYYHCQITNNGVQSQKSNELEQIIWVDFQKLKKLMPTLNPKVINYFK